MTVRGRVHANDIICVGTTASNIFTGIVTSTKTVDGPQRDGWTPSPWNEDTTFSAGYSKVRFISVDRTKETQLGWNLYNLGAGNFVGGVTTTQFYAAGDHPPVAGSSAGVTNGSGLNISAFYPGLGLGTTIMAEDTRTGSQVLAEPNLVTANGKEASFLAGGEYPYPIAQFVMSCSLVQFRIAALISEERDET